MYEQLAQLYDHVFRNDEMTRQELDFLEWAFAHLARREVRELRDVACGTGRQALPLAARGFQVTASDQSQAMLACLQAKPGAQELQLLRLDMAGLSETASCDALICCFSAFNHLLTDTEIMGALEGFHRALRPGGLLVFDVANFFNLLGRYKETVTRHVDAGESSDGLTEAYSVIHHSVDDFEGLFRHQEDLFICRGGAWTHGREYMALRMFTRRELVADLHLCGFEEIRCFRAWEDRGQAAGNTFRLVFTAVRP
jgi:SAM-dependent methyltransferase